MSEETGIQVNNSSVKYYLNNNGGECTSFVDGSETGETSVWTITNSDGSTSTFKDVNNDGRIDVFSTVSEKANDDGSTQIIRNTDVYNTYAASALGEDYYDSAKEQYDQFVNDENTTDEQKVELNAFLKQIDAIYGDGDGTVDASERQMGLAALDARNSRGEFDGDIDFSNLNVDLGTGRMNELAKSLDLETNFTEVQAGDSLHKLMVGTEEEPGIMTGSQFATYQTAITDAIIELNAEKGIKTNGSLRTGEAMYIPTIEELQELVPGLRTEEFQAELVGAADEASTYTVQSGECLTSIAGSKYGGLSYGEMLREGIFDEVIAANDSLKDLDSHIRVGQELNLPEIPQERIDEILAKREPVEEPEEAA